MSIERAHLLVLNFNGRALLRECLPSILAAARAAPVPCGVTVVDNGSNDGSVHEIAREWPDVGLVSCPNEGLASFNRVLRYLREPAVMLLNNDVKLAPDCIGPLLASLERHDDALFAAPQCWTFDGQEYEGMRTRVRMRYGLIQGLCRVPGHENLVLTPDITASAGPALMVDRAKFLALRGYDRLYLPGRIEDLDLGFAGWMRGWRGYYVPESRAWHKGGATFERDFGHAQNLELATRNTLLFSWKNLRGRRFLSHLAWLPARLVHSLASGRAGFARALGEALRRLPHAYRARRETSVPRSRWIARQEEFFQQMGF